MDSREIVFISYAREDQSWAERLYMDLRKQEVNAWLDIRCLAAGSDWKLEIKKAIRNSRYFILLLSKHSVTKRGFVQKEMKEAINVLQEFPKGSIFLIPARLDQTEPVDDELRALNWVDVAPELSFWIRANLEFANRDQEGATCYGPCSREAGPSSTVH